MPGTKFEPEAFHTHLNRALARAGYGLLLMLVGSIFIDVPHYIGLALTGAGLVQLFVVPPLTKRRWVGVN